MSDKVHKKYRKFAGYCTDHKGRYEAGHMANSNADSSTNHMADRKVEHDAVSGKTCIGRRDKNERFSADVLRLAGSSHRREKEFFAWFREDVLGLSSETYRREFWHTASTSGHTIGDVPLTFRGWQHSRGVRPGDLVADTVFVALCVGGPALAFYLVRKCIRRHLAKLRRPTYYESELLRRYMLGKTRRMIMNRSTNNPMPTMDDIRRAWNGARHNPKGALFLGGMLEDLECYVDNHALGNEYVGYCGRRGGIKRLLEKEAPDLFKHYAALMRYKSIARKYRQACGANDPIPADALLPLDDASGTIPPTRSVEGMNFPQRNYEVAEEPLEMAAKILGRCENSVISLEASLALELDPDCIGMEDTRFGPIKSSNSARLHGGVGVGCNLNGDVLEGVGTMALRGMGLVDRKQRKAPDRVAVWIRRRAVA